jgi:hypothetical protein
MGETILALLGLLTCVGLLILIAFFLSKKGTIWNAQPGESVAIVVENNNPVGMILESQRYDRTDRWEITNSEDLKNGNPNYTFAYEKPFLGMRWVGIPPFRRLETLKLECRDFTADKNAVVPCEVTEFTNIPLFHNHAYITPEVEISGNLRVILKFLVRFRITNPYKAKYVTANIMDNLESALLSMTKASAQDEAFEKLTDGINYMDELKNKVNEEIKHYGIKVVGFHFVDIEGADKKTRDALESIKLAEIKAEEILKLKKAEADGDRMVQQVAVDMETALFKQLKDLSGGNADLIRAFALSKMRNLTAYSSSGEGFRQTYDINNPKQS